MSRLSRSLPRTLARRRPLPTRTPGAALNDAVARYALGGSPLYPDDELYIAPSGALIHVHRLTDEEISR